MSENQDDKWFRNLQWATWHVRQWLKGKVVCCTCPLFPSLPCPGDRLLLRRTKVTQNSTIWLIPLQKGPARPSSIKYRWNNWVKVAGGYLGLLEMIFSRPQTRTDRRKSGDMKGAPDVGVRKEMEGGLYLYNIAPTYSRLLHCLSPFQFKKRDRDRDREIVTWDYKTCKVCGLFFYFVFSSLSYIYSFTESFVLFPFIFSPCSEFNSFFLFLFFPIGFDLWLVLSIPIQVVHLRGFIGLKKSHQTDTQKGRRRRKKRRNSYLSVYFPSPILFACSAPFDDALFFSSALLCCSFPSDTVEISLVRISGRIDQWLYDDDDVICW